MAAIPQLTANLTVYWTCGIAGHSHRSMEESHLCQWRRLRARPWLIEPEPPLTRQDAQEGKLASGLELPPRDDDGGITEYDLLPDAD